MQRLRSQQSQMISRSSVIVQQTKSNQANSLRMLTKQLGYKQLISFLTGFVIGQLKLTSIHRDNPKILKKIAQSIDLIEDKVIQSRNVIEITVEALQATKKLQTSQNQRYYQNKPKNQMRSEYQQHQEIRSNSQNFIEIFSVYLSQLALDRDYLINLWAAQRIKQQQQRVSEEAIKKLMDEQDRIERQKRSKNRMAMEEQNQKLVRNLLNQQKNKMKQQQNKKLQCQICLVDIEYSDLGTLSCGHIFHRGCIYEHIKSAVLSNKVQMNCPMEDCSEKISINDIQQYLDGDLLQKFNQFCLNHYVQKNNKDTSWCPTAGCTALFEFDQELDNYRCPACKKHYCLKCRCDYHYGMSCAEYKINNTHSKDDQKFEDFVRGAKFKQCPKCKFWVQRVAGCSSMACRCGIEFCYDCGGTGCPHGSCSNSGRNGGVVGAIGPVGGVGRLIRRR